MKKIFFFLVVLITFSTFANVFINFDSFLGVALTGKMVLDGEERTLDMFTNYGVQLALDYGLFRGLRFGAIFSSQSVSLKFEGENLSFNLLCLGGEGLFVMNFLDLAMHICADTQFVLTSFLLGEEIVPADFKGHVFGGKVVFEKCLSENFSVAFGGGLKYFSVESAGTSVNLNGFVPHAVLRMSYSF